MIAETPEQTAPRSRVAESRMAESLVQRAPEVAKRERADSVMRDIALRPVHAVAHASGDPDAHGVRLRKGRRVVVPKSMRIVGSC